jgi:hypothetical protein
VAVDPISAEEVAGRKGVLRRWMWIYIVAFAIIGIGLVGFTLIVLREKPGGECEDVLGPIQPIEQRVGFGLVLDPPVGPIGAAGNIRDSDCSVTLVEALPRLRNPIVIVVNRHVANLDTTKQELAQRGYADAVTVAAGVLLFAPPADASYYVVLYSHGDVLSRFDLLRAAFTLDSARGFATDLGNRAR